MAGSGSPLGINERKEIKRLLGKMSLTKIAERINRSKNCVITEVRLNGGQLNYDPVKAHERANDVQKEGRERANALNKMQIVTQDAKRLIESIYSERMQFSQARQDLQDLLRQAKGMAHLLPLIQKLDERIVRLEESEFSNVKPLYIDAIVKRLSSLEKKKSAFLDRPPVDKKKPHIENPPTTGRYIKLCEWHEYRSWPSQSDINKFVRERETNGFHTCCFKPGRQWVIDEDRYLEWEKIWKESLSSKTIKTEVS